MVIIRYFTAAKIQDVGLAVCEFGRWQKAAGQDIAMSKPILELNPEHKLVTRLKDMSDEEALNNWSHILFDQAMLAEGGQLEDPAAFVKRVNQML